jgi:hypothetical protein
MSELRNYGIVQDPYNEEGGLIALDYIPFDTEKLEEAASKFFIDMDLQQEEIAEAIQDEIQMNPSSGQELGQLISMQDRIKDVLDITTNRWWTVQETHSYWNRNGGIIQSRWLTVEPADSEDDEPLISVNLDTGMVEYKGNYPSQGEVDIAKEQLTRLELYWA